jgi:hypothetical protein
MTLVLHVLLSGSGAALPADGLAYETRTRGRVAPGRDVDRCRYADTSVQELKSLIEAKLVGQTVEGRRA